MRVLLLISLLLISALSKAQLPVNPSSPRVFTPDQMISDCKYLRTVLEKAHPSLYRYATKDSMDYYFDKTLSKFDHPMSEVEYWCHLQYLVAKIGSGHTQVLFSQSFENNYNQDTHYVLPFGVYIKDNKLYVKRLIGKIDTAFFSGYQIISVNGENKQQLFRKIRTLISGDGRSYSYKNYELEIGEFNRLYELTHPSETEFSVLFKTFSRKDKLVTLAARLEKYHSNKDTSTSQLINLPLNGIHYTNNLDNNLPDSLVHRITYLKDKPSIAILQIKSFTYTDYLSFHKELFKNLHQRNIKDLIIDIRNNGGGSDYICIDFLKYLMNDSFYFTKKDEGVVDLKAFNLWLSRKEADTINLSKIEHKSYTIIYDANKLNKPYKDNFKGRIHLLFNGGTYSAASLFAVALKTQQPSTNTYGSETGGGQAGCDGGEIVKIKLPRTSLQLRLPLLWTYSVCTDANQAKGLIPDHLISSNWIDYTYRSVLTQIP